MLSANKSDLLDNDYDDDGSDSGSYGTCAFPFCFEQSVGRVDYSVGCVAESIFCVCGVGCGAFFMTGIESIGDFFLLVVFVLKGVNSKGGQLIELFWRPKFAFTS